MTTTATASTAPTLFDADEVRRALGLLLATGDTMELRVLDASFVGDRRTGTLTGYFDDPEKLIEALGTIRVAKGVYFTANPVDPALKARALNRVRYADKGESTADTNIVKRTRLLLDADPVRPSGISSTDDEHQAALAMITDIDAHLADRVWPAGIVADSGNGAHLILAIDLPTDDGGLVKRCLAALAARFDTATVRLDQSVFNPARIWKLPGTLTRKGDNTADRPHRMARIINAPDELLPVPIDLLEALAAEASSEALATNGNAQRPQQNGLQPFDVEGFIARNNFDVAGPRDWTGRQGQGRTWEFRTSPICDHHDGAAHIEQHASGAVTASCLHQSCSWNWDDLRAKYEPKQPSQYASIGSGIASHVDNSQPPERNGHHQAGQSNRDDHADGRITYEVLTSEQLDAGRYELEYLIDRTLVAGQPCIVAGGKKSLKTSLLVDMALSLATGTKFLGTQEVNRVARVALMSGESGLATLQETARRVARSKGFDLRDATGLVWSPDLPKFGDFRHVEALKCFIDEHGIEVIEIDPAYMAMPGGDAGNLFIQGELLRSINDICQSKGVTLILAHHTRKGIVDPFSPPELDDIAWAGFQEFARQWLLVGRRERYEPGTGSHRLWLNVGGSAGHSALWAVNIEEGVYSGHTPRNWDVEVQPAQEARDAVEERREETKREKQAAKLERDKRTVLAALVGCPEARGTKREIRDRAGVNGQAFNLAWADLLASHDIVADGSITRENNQPYPAFRAKVEG